MCVFFNYSLRLITFTFEVKEQRKGFSVASHGIAVAPLVVSFKPDSWAQTQKGIEKKALHGINKSPRQM